MNTKYFDVGVETTLKGTSMQQFQEEDTFLKLMKEKMEKQEVILVTFSSADQKGNLKINHNGWLMEMPNAECNINRKEYDVKYKHHMLNRQYNVMITQIDEENKKIMVSYALVARILRQHVMQKIMTQLEVNKKKPTEKKSILLPGKVTRIDEESGYIFLDLCGYQITGCVKPTEWDKQQNGENILPKIGESYDVVVYSAGRIVSGNMNGLKVFYCSRRRIVSNEWDGIQERYVKGDIVNVTCVRINKASGTFLGKIEGEDIPVLCLYSVFKNKGNEDLIVRNGVYQAKVIKVSEEKRRFIVNVFRKVN